jgi:hypothetical protein
MERSVEPPILRAFRDLVRHREDLSGVFIQQQVVVTEMTAGHVPVKVLGLQVERERGGQDLFELGRNLADRIGGKIGRCIKRGRLAARVEGSDFAHGGHLAE